MLFKHPGRLCLAIFMVCLMTAAMANPAARLSASPASGDAPLTVEFTGGVGGVSYFGGVIIEFGDGSRARFCEPGQSCDAVSIQHVYRQRGEYVARLLGRGEGEPRQLATVAISID